MNWFFKLKNRKLKVCVEFFKGINYANCFGMNKNVSKKVNCSH